MKGPCGRPDCPTEERRRSERRQSRRQDIAWCARVVGAVVAATSLVSIASAVTISSHLARMAINEERKYTNFQEQQYYSLARRVAALELRSYQKKP